MIHLELSKPKRQFESLEDARIKESLWRDHKDGKYPCIVCRGKGAVIVPGEQCDPCEGYKFAKHIKCSACKGTGTCTKKKFKEWYRKEHLKPYEESIQKYKRDKETLDRLKIRLAREEFEVLRKAFLNIYYI